MGCSGMKPSRGFSLVARGKLDKKNPNSAPGKKKENLRSPAPRGSSPPKDLQGPMGPCAESFLRRGAPAIWIYPFSPKITQAEPKPTWLTGQPACG